jgi:hypothetical protein
MNIPLLSIFTLCTELLVTVSVVYIIRKAYTTGIFARSLAFGVLAYEVLFNITYMVSRELLHAPSVEAIEESSGITTLAIFHGVFSLVMFIALVAFFVIAARAYKNGENFFLTHQKSTITFLTAWSISIFSGIFFFLLLYVFH